MTKINESLRRVRVSMKTCGEVFFSDVVDGVSEYGFGVRFVSSLRARGEAGRPPKGDFGGTGRDIVVVVFMAPDVRCI